MISSTRAAAERLYEYNDLDICTETLVKMPMNTVSMLGEIGPYAACVFALLAELARDVDGHTTATVVPNKTVLGRALGLDRRTVSASLDRLQMAEMITVQTTPGSHKLRILIHFPGPKPKRHLKVVQ